MKSQDKREWHFFAKRSFDIPISISLLVFFAPVLAAISAAIALESRGGIFYSQLRPGKGGRLFRILKFRTMKDVCDENGNQLPDDLRLTKLGKQLRNWSLDELPELWNVLKGDMSIVGPRPLLIEYIPLYSTEQIRRHDVLPGITGWAQVNGRNAITWEEKFGHDLWYVKNWGMKLDLQIIRSTLISVIKREGINQLGQATAEKFKGSGGDNGR